MPGSSLPAKNRQDCWRSTDRIGKVPGFAIPDKNGLLVGNSAAVSQAHLFPIQVINRFWDRLNTEPLKQKNRLVQNHAEIACAHLSQIWENVKIHGDEMIVAVPDYYGREQLGLILGMAQELSIPVKGFVPLPIAASFTPLVRMQCCCIWTFIYIGLRSFISIRVSI